jgi:pimeloyl-ACP methyl ester carboxylesterase
VTFLEPSNLAPRGTLVVIPGRGERPQVYHRFGTRIAFDAYRVHVVDDPTVDESRVRRQVLESSTAAVGPVVLVGVDAGALFAARLAADGLLPQFDALILAGLPGAGQAGVSSASWEEELDARTTCPTHRGRISGDLVTPGALYGPIPPEWSDGGVIAKADKPILAIHGSEDAISTLESAREAYGAAPHVELVAVAGAHHDVLNDQSHRTVAATIVLWLERLRANGDLAPIASLEPVAAGSLPG